MGSEALRALAAMAALLLAGCAAPGGALDPAASPESAPQLRETRVLVGRASEPAIVEHPDGTLFVAAYGEGQAERVARPLLMRSDDGGQTWARVEQGAPVVGPLGNSDTDLAIAPDGTLYHATMQYVPWGHAISVGASPDKGATWTWRKVAVAPWVDRPWVDVGPDGAAHLTWSSPLGLHHATSRDSGESWQEGPLVHPSGGSGGLAVGPRGELAVRFFPLRGPSFFVAAFAFAFVDPEADGVAVSADGGETWTLRELPGNRTYPDALGNGGDAPRWADPVAFDEAGTLYTAWGEGDAILLAASRDLGATWDVRTLARAEGRAAFFPYLDAGAPGELAATWYSYAEGDLLAHVARVEAADQPSARVVVHDVETASDLETFGEYFQTALLREGGLVAALPVGTGDTATSGFALLRA